jgi:hypothetical protein
MNGAFPPYAVIVSLVNTVPVGRRLNSDSCHSYDRLSRGIPTGPRVPVCLPTPPRRRVSPTFWSKLLDLLLYLFLGHSIIEVALHRFT